MRAQSGGRARASPVRGEATHPRSDRSPPAAPRPSSLKGANPKTQKSHTCVFTSDRPPSLAVTYTLLLDTQTQIRTEIEVPLQYYLMVLFSAVLSGPPEPKTQAEAAAACRLSATAGWVGVDRPGERGWGRAARTPRARWGGPTSAGARLRARGTRAVQGMMARCRGLLRQTVSGLARKPPPSSNQCKGKAREDELVRSNNSGALFRVFIGPHIDIYICV